MSGRFGRPPRDGDNDHHSRSHGSSFNGPSSPGSQRSVSKADVQASLERARNQLGGDSSDEDYGANPYGADYGAADSAPYTRDRDDSLDEMVHVGDIDYEPTEFSPRNAASYDYEASDVSPRAQPDRASPRAAQVVRASPRGQERPSPRGADRPAAGRFSAPAKASPRGNERPSPRGNDRPSPRGNERPSPRGNDRPSPRGNERPSPRGNERPSPRGNDRPSPRAFSGREETQLKSDARPSPRPDRHPPRNDTRASPRGYERASPRATQHQQASPRHEEPAFQEEEAVYDFPANGAMGSVPMPESRSEACDALMNDDNYMMFGMKHMQLKKDAHTYIDPHLVISVVDKKGNLMEAVQRTPNADVDGQMLIFDYVLSLETNIATLIDRGGAIFFEMRHLKCKDDLNMFDVPKEQGRYSVKAYSYINAKEIQHMACRLPIYKSDKPTDFRRVFKPAPLSLTQTLFTHLDVITGTKAELMTNWGYTSPRPDVSSSSVVNIFFDNIGIKDAHSRDLGHGSGYVNPRMQVTVVDAKGGRIDKTYITAEATEKKFQKLIFNQDLAIPLHVQDLEDLDACFYFEFVHWKAHKGKDSVKCYSYMPVSQMKNGRFKLPVYQCEKPTDMSRRFVPGTLSIRDKDLWLRAEFFCEDFVNRGDPGNDAEVDYSANETAVNYGEEEREQHEDDGVAYTGAEDYDERKYDQNDYGSSGAYENDAYDPNDVDPEGLVQYTSPSRNSTHVDV